MQGADIAFSAEWNDKAGESDEQKPQNDKVETQRRARMWQRPPRAAWWRFCGFCGVGVTDLNPN